MVQYYPCVSFTRTHYELYTYFLRSPDRNMTKFVSFALLSFRCIRIELCYHWTIALFLSSDHLHLTSVHKDRLRPSQAPSTTIGLLQLWSYRVVQVTDYEWYPFFLYVSGSNPLLELPGSWSSITYLYLAAFILFMHARKAVVCATRC